MSGSFSLTEGKWTPEPMEITTVTERGFFSLSSTREPLATVVHWCESCRERVVRFTTTHRVVTVGSKGLVVGLRNSGLGSIPTTFQLLGFKFLSRYSLDSVRIHN